MEGLPLGVLILIGLAEPAGKAPGRAAPSATAGGSAPLVGLEQAPDLALLLLALELLALVVLRQALGHGQLDLGVAIAKVNSKRDEGVAPLLGLPGEAGDLLLVEQELARAARVGVVARALLVGRDVDVVQEDLARSSSSPWPRGCPRSPLTSRWPGGRSPAPAPPSLRPTTASGSRPG